MKRRDYNLNSLRHSFIYLMALLSVLSLQAQDISKDLVLALTFDEGAGQIITDRSGQGNNGKINGKIGWIEVKIGRGSQLNGKT